MIKRFTIKLLLHLPVMFLPSINNTVGFRKAFVVFYRGEHLLLFLAQTVARQTIEQRQFRPHRTPTDSRPKAKSKTLGASGTTPPLPEHDLEPPRFARRALEYVLQDWRAVSAMMRDGCNGPCSGETKYDILL